MTVLLLFYLRGFSIGTSDQGAAIYTIPDRKNHANALNQGIKDGKEAKAIATKKMSLVFGDK